MTQSALASSSPLLTKIAALRPAAIALGVCLALTACGGNKGKSNLGPDEFSVVDRAPLAIPPEADLAPPRPGEPRAQEIDPGQQAYDALFPGQKLKRSKPLSSAERNLLRYIPKSDGDVRNELTSKDPVAVKKRLLLSELLTGDDHQYAPDNVSVRHVSTQKR